MQRVIEAPAIGEKFTGTPLCKKIPVWAIVARQTGRIDFARVLGIYGATNAIDRE